MQPDAMLRTRTGVLAAWSLAAFAWAGACGQDHQVTGPEESISPLIVSDPALGVALPSGELAVVPNADRNRPSLAGGSGALTHVVFISLPPGTVATGTHAIIRNQRTGATVTVQLVAGGFDPVAIQADENDVVEIEVHRAGALTPLRFTHTVPGKRPPKVVRTNPPRGKRDVALNSRISVVFSEPMDARTVTEESVRLLRGAVPVAGRIEFEDEHHITASFVPNELLAAVTEYRLVVSRDVYDLDGDAVEDSMTVEFTTAAATLIAPAATDARPATSTTVDVRWADNSANEDGFRIERAIYPGGFLTIDSTGANVTSFADSGLPSWVRGVDRICYRVTAFNALVESLPSNADCTFVYPPPAHLAAARVALRIVQLSWVNHLTPDNAGYEVLRSGAASGPFVPVTTVPWRGDCCSHQSYSTHYDTVPSGAAYWYRIRRVTQDSGYSDFSTTVGATDSAAAPKAASGTVAFGRETSMRVSWADSSVNEEGFRVERSIDAGTSWETVGRTGPNVNATGENVIEFGDKATAEQTVCYRVFAFNGMGDSPPSETSCTAVPAAPGLVSVVAVEPWTVEITWTDNSNVEDGYVVFALDGGCCEVPLIELAANAKSVRLSLSENEFGYRVFVRAYKGRSYSSSGQLRYPP